MINKPHFLQFVTIINISSVKHYRLLHRLLDDSPSRKTELFPLGYQNQRIRIKSRVIHVVRIINRLSYPAAGLINYYRGHRLVVVNKAPTPADSSADLVLQGAIGELFRQIEL